MVSGSVKIIDKKTGDLVNEYTKDSSFANVPMNFSFSPEKETAVSVDAQLLYLPDQSKSALKVTQKFLTENLDIVFRTFEPIRLAGLASSLYERHLKLDETLILENSSVVDAVYILIAGRLRAEMDLTLEAQNAWPVSFTEKLTVLKKRRVRYRVFSIARPGEVFGVRAFQRQMQSKVTLKCDSETAHVVVINKDVLDECKPFFAGLRVYRFQE